MHNLSKDDSLGTTQSTSSPNTTENQLEDGSVRSHSVSKSVQEDNNLWNGSNKFIPSRTLTGDFQKKELSQADNQQVIEARNNQDQEIQTSKSHIDNFSLNHRFDDFESILPMNIDGFLIEKLSWDHFKGQPEQQSQWKAHAFWTCGYDFQAKMKKNKKTGFIKFKLQVSSWTVLSSKSWVKLKIPRLLEHETGHYILGCLCALDFKVRAQRSRFSKNYNLETQKLFNQTFQEYIKQEKLYDLETDHSRNVSSQKKWNAYFRKQLLTFQSKLAQ